ncbi:hypothetical protein G9A89_015119 [Geosiphon pyriformis]|nr:hypothetical protein G9A89_015119 [Geosiphon pyriformis]
MEKATSLARENNIIVNIVVIKEIPIDTPKEIIIITVSEFGQVVSIRLQLIGLWQKAVVEFAKLSQADQLAARWSFLIGKDSVHMAKAVKDHETWASRDWYRVLLFTLPMKTMAHDLGNFLARAGGKTCIINQSLDIGNKVCCAVVCFENDEDLESAFHTEPIFGGVRLSWARLDMVWCEQYGKLNHSVLECNAETSTSPTLFKSFKRIVSDENHLQLAKLYAKKSVVSLVSSFHGPHFGSGPGFGSSSGASGVIGHLSPADPVSSILKACLVSLERSLELLMDKVSGIIDKLDSLNLVPLALAFSFQPLVVPGLVNMKFGSDMVLDEPESAVLFSSSVSSGASSLSLSSSKILTSKVGCLESKLMALKASVCSVLEKLDQMCAGSVWKIATCNVREMNNLAKQENIICWHRDMNNLVSIVTKTKLKDKVWSWIVNKFDGVRVFISSLDSGYLGSGVVIIMNITLAKHVCKVFEMLSRLLSVKLFFKNKLSVSILGLYAGVLVSVCFSQVDKTIDYVFVSSSLVNAILDRSVTRVDEYFDTDHRTVNVSVGLGSLLDVNLMSLCKQANKNHWKFNFKDAMAAKWAAFKESSAATMAIFKYIICKVVCLSVTDVFKKKWFKDYDNVFTKESSKFYKLELLGSKLVKASRLVFSKEFVALLRLYFEVIRSVLFRIRKLYCFSKLSESKHAEESHIRSAVSRKIESFEVDKGHTIRSVLEHPFHKVVLDHLVVNNELVLNPNLVKSKVDVIMEDWTRKRELVTDISADWYCQYQPLEYIFDDTFSRIIDPISSVELLGIVSDLPNNKAAGLSACSTHNILCRDNFLVLKGMTTQSPIFAVGSVVENTLEKNRELWLVLQDIKKAYDSVGWEHLKKSLIRIKMCSRFIQFFGGIHNNWVNRVMTDFGLTDGYQVHDGLNQEKDALIHKGFKSKVGLPSDFFNDALYHPSLYGLKTFEQIQAESKSASVVCFANAVGILSCLFLHRSYDLQTLSWHPVHPLVSPAYLVLNLLNNFLVGVVLVSAPVHSDSPMYGIAFVEQLCQRNGSAFDWKTFKCWKRLDPRGLIPDWFSVSIGYLGSAESSSSVLDCSVGIFFAFNVLESTDFDLVCNRLLRLDADSLSVYTNGSLAGLGTLSVKLGMVVFFDNINMSLGVRVSDLLSSTLAKLQAIALALECVSVVSKVCLFLDSQAALNTCRLELGLAHPDFRNSCWVECYHIANFVHAKRLDISCAGHAALSDFVLSLRLNEQFILAGGSSVLGNSRHFMHDIFWSIHRLRWGFGSGARVVTGKLLTDINWRRSSSVWHPNSHMAAGFTSIWTAGLRTYFIKALHRRLPVAVHKCLYNRSYPSVVCLYCGCVEASDHVFSCDSDSASRDWLLGDFAVKWKGIFGFHSPSSHVLQTLSSCVFDASVCVALCKDFAVSVFGDLKLAGAKIVDFVHDFCLAFRDEIWLVRVKHYGSMPVAVSGLSSLYSAGVVRLLGIDDALGIRFGLRKFNLFVSGALDVVSVHIGA